MNVGDRVVIVESSHPWFGRAGVILEWTHPHACVVELDEPPGHRAVCARSDIRAVSDLA